MDLKTVRRDHECANVAVPRLVLVQGAVHRVLHIAGNEGADALGGHPRLHRNSALNLHHVHGH